MRSAKLLALPARRIVLRQLRYARSSCLDAPFELRNSRLTSTIVIAAPGHDGRVALLGDGGDDRRPRGSPRPHSDEEFVDILRQRRRTAMRSWLSEMASSVPSRPSYFFGTRSRSMSQAVRELVRWRPNTPPAPKSLQRLISRQASLAAEEALRSCARRARCPSAPRRRRSRCFDTVWALEEPVAPPMPSRPVRPPSRMIASPGSGRLAAHVVGRV